MVLKRTMSRSRVESALGNTQSLGLTRKWDMQVQTPSTPLSSVLTTRPLGSKQMKPSCPSPVPPPAASLEPQNEVLGQNLALHVYLSDFISLQNMQNQDGRSYACTDGSQVVRKFNNCTYTAIQMSLRHIMVKQDWIPKGRI